MQSVYILGGQQSDFERNYKKEGKGIRALLKETMDDALTCAHMDYADIAALRDENRIEAFVGNFGAEQYLSQGHLGAFLTQVDPAFCGVASARYEAACASSSTALSAAITKIGAGLIDVAVVVGVEIMKTLDSARCGDVLGMAAHYEREARGVSFPFPKLFGRLADVYLERFDVPEERYMNALAEISLKNYTNAKRNERAQTRNWFMCKEQTRTRGTATNACVGGRLAVSDCSQVTDGAAVVFLCSETYAKKYAAKRKIAAEKIPVVKGFGLRVAPLLFADKIAESKEMDYVLPWTRRAVLDAYERAGMTLSDIDVIETHDCFTSSEYAAISAFGLTAPGEEYKAVEDGVTQLGGRWPINPSGGLIGVGHPVGASGARMFLDLYKQVTGQAGGYQVENAKNALMLNIGGSATTNYTFIVGRV